MANKHKSKYENRGPLWTGLYVRKTKTKKEKEDALRKKHREASLQRQEGV